MITSRCRAYLELEATAIRQLQLLTVEPAVPSLSHDGRIVCQDSLHVLVEDVGPERAAFWNIRRLRRRDVHPLQVVP